MMMTQRDLQAAIRQARRKTKVPRYSAEVRAAVSDLVRTARSKGTSLSSVAEALELPINTVRRWCTRRSELAPVEVVPEVSPGGLVLVTPCGHRVEGLSVASLAALLERLG